MSALGTLRLEFVAREGSDDDDDDNDDDDNDAEEEEADNEEEETEDDVLGALRSAAAPSTTVSDKWASSSSRIWPRPTRSSPPNSTFRRLLHAYSVGEVCVCRCVGGGCEMAVTIWESIQFQRIRTMYVSEYTYLARTCNLNLSPSRTTLPPHHHLTSCEPLHSPLPFA